MPTVNLTKPQTQFRRLKCKYPAFVAGFGTGKTQIMITAAFEDKLAFPKSTVALYEPTYDLAKLILVPRMLEILDYMGLPYRHNKTENVIYLGDFGKFIIRTLDNPSRIVGYEAFRSHIDELDVLQYTQAQEAWNKIVARNREKVDGKPPNRVSVYSTPEGFKFLYRKWVKEKDPNDSRYQMIQASTYSNAKNLPEDYIDDLRATYPANLVEAYINGQFVNLTSGTVYVSFNRTLNHSDVVEEKGEPLHVGMDFNVGRGCAVVHVLREENPVAIAEVIDSYDTPDTIRVLKERYGAANHPISVYPDATGRNRKSVNATESDISLLKGAGFRVIRNKSNPAIKDRVAAMNGQLCNQKGERRYKVNTRRCPHYTDGLEQQVYDKNGLPEKGEGKFDDVNDAGGYYICKQFPVKQRRIYETKVVGL